MLRQFIDRIDELSYCLITVLAPTTFLTDDQRGVRKYDALYLRIPHIGSFTKESKVRMEIEAVTNLLIGLAI